MVVREGGLLAEFILHALQQVLPRQVFESEKKTRTKGKLTSEENSFHKLNFPLESVDFIPAKEATEQLL